MKTYLIYNRRKTLDKNGEAQIELCVYKSRSERSYFPIGIKVRPDQWDDNNKRIIKHLNERSLNITLKRFWLDKEEQLLEEKKELEIKTFNTFYEWYLKQQPKLTVSSLGAHKQTLTYLNKFNPVLTWDKIDKSFPERFETLLISEGLSHNTIWKHHKNVKAYLNHAITYGLFPDSQMKWPYIKYKITKKPGKKIALTDKEVESLGVLQLDGYKKIVRDMFLFSCYTGLRFSDVLNLQPAKHIDVRPEGPVIVLDRMIKVDRPVQLRLYTLFAGKPEAIYKEYIKDKTFLFPHTSNSQVNLALKDLKELAGITKPLSFHVSRHTFLTAIAIKTKDMFQVKRLGGIAKNETAMIYVNLADPSYDDSLEDIKW